MGPAAHDSKSGGVRVIYYIFFLTPYGRAEKDDLSAAELKRVVALLTELTDD